MTTTIPAGWKLVPASLYDLILMGDLETLLWQLKGVREAESVRMALYSARQAILDAEEYSDGTPCAAPGVSTVEDERQAFEAWAKGKKMPLARIGQQYDDFWVDHAWNGWQARAALDAPAAGDALDAARYRWLCDKFGITKLPCAIERIIEGTYVADGKEGIDAAIDAAIAAQRKGDA